MGFQCVITKSSKHVHNSNHFRFTYWSELCAGLCCTAFMFHYLMHCPVCRPVLYCFAVFYVIPMSWRKILLRVRPHEALSPRGALPTRRGYLTTLAAYARVSHDETGSERNWRANRQDSKMQQKRRMDKRRWSPTWCSSSNWWRHCGKDPAGQPCPGEESLGNSGGIFVEWPIKGVHCRMLASPALNTTTVYCS